MKPQADERFAIDCNSAISTFDSSHAILFKYDQSTSSLSQVAAVKSGAVINQAAYACKSGAYIYTTEERMTVSLTGTLHVLLKNKEKKGDVTEGINAVFPLRNGNLFIRTKRIKFANIDPVLGYLSLRDLSDNASVESQKLTNDTAHNTQKLHRYLEVVQYDISKMSKTNAVRGTYDAHSFQNERLITFSRDHTAIELDPLTGKRKLIHDFGDPSQAAFPDFTYVYKESAFSVKKQNNLNGDSFIKQSTVNKFNDFTASWEVLAHVPFTPSFMIADKERIVLFNDTQVGIFDISKGTLQVIPFPLSGYRPLSAGVIAGGWAVAVENVGSGGHISDDRLLLVISDDWSTLSARHQLLGLADVQVSTTATLALPR